ncbi:hypothetical protein K432DRAFT_349323 [Lepidopterella palustris CBS 459.81]|uniref:Solute carrier family 40 member n=1 Tax=Lepidopterella palustris CBS 459.81 TaxID=1314670 RepID=A0A8E2JH42_9PEZI|nr:hypothetical protein K432DRAFT_349323 [Lepidopterella palustris CBS 459.81]
MDELAPLSSRNSRVASPLTAPNTSHDVPLDNVKSSPRSVLLRLYLSHTLSSWNSRTFEFGAVLFLATIFPGTLFYASCYALFRSAAAVLLSSSVGALVDQTSRLTTVRHSIVWQRVPVAISCLLLLLILHLGNMRVLLLSCFAASVALACVEKLASVANTVAIERDWVIVVSESLEIERQYLNGTMRRIDLLCKLIAPVFISLIDGYSTRIAIWFVFAQNGISVLIEYVAIKQVYDAVPALSHHKLQNSDDDLPDSPIPEDASPTLSPPATSNDPTTFLSTAWLPWHSYISNPAFLASFSLSLLYLTVLSTGAQMSTYLLTLHFSGLSVSLMRLLAIVMELSATIAAPLLMKKIGPVRAGLWFINEQLLCVAVAGGLFWVMGEGWGKGAALIAGVTVSRVGLWGFDLCVQFLVQEDALPSSRGRFSASEMALQSFFELLSYATTVIFPKPQDFRYPVLISCGAVAVSAGCFAAFVRQKRGHILHFSKCIKRERYEMVPQGEVGADGLDEV